MQSFGYVTPKGGRKLPKNVSVLVLPEWDIVNALIFYSIRREGQTTYMTKEEVHQVLKGVKLSEDQKALVMCLFQDKDASRT